MLLNPVTEIHPGFLRIEGDEYIISLDPPPAPPTPSLGPIELLPRELYPKGPQPREPMPIGQGSPMTRPLGGV